MTLDFIGYCYSGKTFTAKYLEKEISNVTYWNPIIDFSQQMEKKLRSSKRIEKIHINGFIFPCKREDFITRLSTDIEYLKDFYHFIHENYSDNKSHLSSNVIIRELNPYLGSLYGISMVNYFFEEIDISPYKYINRKGWNNETIFKFRRNQKALVKLINLPAFRNSINISKYPESLNLFNSIRSYANKSYYR